eukprot:jgi/Chlat1/4031/Chrsp26S04088
MGSVKASHSCLRPALLLWQAAFRMVSLGPRWSQLDLEQFMQAYKKHGRDWVKVAAQVPRRTPEMCETYLSLPDAAVNAQVLLAMMNDYYNNMGLQSHGAAEPIEESSDGFHSGTPGSPKPVSSGSTKAPYRRPRSVLRRTPPPGQSTEVSLHRTASGGESQSPAVTPKQVASARKSRSAGLTAGSASIGSPLSPRRRKRSRQLFAAEGGGLDSLAALAEASLQKLNGGSPASPPSSLRKHRRKSSPEKNVHISQTKASPAKSIPSTALPLKLRSKRRSGDSQDTGDASTDGRAAANKPSLKRPSSQCVHILPGVSAESAQVRLQHVLSTRAAKWCMYEWFYSTIDWPWFEKSEFLEYLEHTGLGHITRLTRKEWGLVRGALGRPRRLSQAFLSEERAKLESYREAVRDRHQEFRMNGSTDATLHSPLTVGQKVTARHPKTRQLHEGSILTAERSRCRVQFARHDLGVALVPDTDLRRIDAVDSFAPTPTQPVRQSAFTSADGTGLAGPSGEHMRAAQHAGVASDAHAVPSAGVSPEGRAADVRALVELNRALCKKEALLGELQIMNDEAQAGVHHGDGGGIMQPFQRQYATVLTELHQANKQLEDALIQLRKRNKFDTKRVRGVDSTTGRSPAAVQQDEPAWTAVVMGAQRQAQMMVSLMQDKALQQGAASQLPPAAEETPERVAGTSSPSASAQKAEQQENGIHQLQDEPPSSSGRELLDNGQPHDGSPLIYSITDLVASCVATLTTIQRCSDQPMEPPDVHAALDAVVALLRPRSDANLHVFEDIARSILALKNQLLTGHS